MAKKTKTAAAAPPPPPPTPLTANVVDDNINASSSSDEEADGVDDAGMNRLMELLGDDALDEFDAAQLTALNADSSGLKGSLNSDEEDDNEDWVSDDGTSGESASEQDEDPTSDLNILQDDDGDEEIVALDDVSSVDEDAVPRQKVVIDNKVALARIRETFKLDPSLGWTETLTITYPDPLEINDADDDLQRELALYKQGLHAANTARSLAAKYSLPFTRPTDYFAEMVKSDSHMERVRQRLLDERADISKSEDARRQRELKKVGKQVQVEKVKDRERGKKEMDERLKGLKRKRGKNGVEGPGDDEAFDIAVEDALSGKPKAPSSGPNKRARTGDDAQRGRMPRSARDSKFGFGGGGKRREKQNTRESTDDFGGGGRGGARGGRGGSRGGRGGRGGSGGRGGRGSSRPGKSKRQSGRS